MQYHVAWKILWEVFNSALSFFLLHIRPRSSTAPYPQNQACKRHLPTVLCFSRFFARSFQNLQIYMVDNVWRYMVYPFLCLPSLTLNKNIKNNHCTSSDSTLSVEQIQRWRFLFSEFVILPDLVTDHETECPFGTLKHVVLGCLQQCFENAVPVNFFETCFWNTKTIFEMQCTHTITVRSMLGGLIRLTAWQSKACIDSRGLLC